MLLYIFPSILAVDVSTGTKVIVPSLHAWLDVIAMLAVQSIFLAVLVSTIRG